MTFRPARARTVRWRPVQGPGLEHLTLESDGDEISARGVVIGNRGGRPYGVDYTIVCTQDWVVRRLDLATTAGMALSILSDGAGSWTNHDGRPLPEFGGCVDVHLAGSAFTNTLPIRRLDWAASPGPTELGMVYVPFDTFVPIRDGQVYTALEDRLFDYQATDRSSSARLAVDSDGLVIDYPTLFERVKDH